MSEVPLYIEGCLAHDEEARPLLGPLWAIGMGLPPGAALPLLFEVRRVPWPGKRRNRPPGRVPRAAPQPPAMRVGHLWRDKWTTYSVTLL